MDTPLRIPEHGTLDFLALGALIHRLDPGVVPFRKATSCAIHVSGGEFNTAANLADCFGLRTGVASAMVEYPIGELIAGQVRSMGVTPFYKMFKHDGAWGPNMAAVYSDRGHGVRAPVVFYNRSNEAAARLKPGDFDWDVDLRRRRALVSQRRHLRVAVGDDVGADHRRHAGGAEARRRRVVRSELSREALERFRRRGARGGGPRPHRRSTSTCSSATRRICRRAWALPGPKSPRRRRSIRARSSA